MLESTDDESEFPPSLPPPRPLSPMFMGTPERESYKSPSESDIGLKRPRHPRARSPPEAPRRKGLRIGSAPRLFLANQPISKSSPVQSLVVDESKQEDRMNTVQPTPVSVFAIDTCVGLLTVSR